MPARPWASVKSARGASSARSTLAAVVLSAVTAAQRSRSSPVICQPRSRLSATPGAPCDQVVAYGGVKLPRRSRRSMPRRSGQFLPVGIEPGAFVEQRALDRVVVARVAGRGGQLEQRPRHAGGAVGEAAEPVHCGAPAASSRHRDRGGRSRRARRRAASRCATRRASPSSGASASRAAIAPAVPETRSAAAPAAGVARADQPRRSSPAAARRRAGARSARRRRRSPAGRRTARARRRRGRRRRARAPAPHRGERGAPRPARRPSRRAARRETARSRRSRRPARGPSARWAGRARASSREDCAPIQLHCPRYQTASRTSRSPIRARGGEQVRAPAAGRGRRRRDATNGRTHRRTRVAGRACRG